MKSRAPELALAVVAAFLTVVVTYAVARLVQWRLYPEPDPALIVWSTRIAMFWRMGLGVYVAAIVAPLVFVLARRDLVRTARALAVSVPLVAILAALQGALVP